jgi:protease-4
VKQITQARQIDQAKLERLLDKGILSPPEALAAGLLDGLIYPDQLEEEASKVLGSKATLMTVSVDPPDERDTRWGLRPQVAVIRVEGDIVRGEGTRDPFGAVAIAGSDVICRRIHEAADDPQVAAIVVRIDSPGGDGNASDLIWRELVRARKEKKKPVIASMGDTAASGGYYVAVGADEIFAEPSTVTGSIGVFVPHFDAGELFDKLGLHFVTVKRGASADLFSPSRTLTDEERRTLQAAVETMYDLFLDRVAQSRSMTKPEVDDVGRGRVFTGAQALKLRLVDRMGSLQDAIATAKRYAGVADAEIEDELPVQVELADLTGATLMPPAIASRALHALHLVGDPGSIRAAMPFDLEIH